CSGARIAACSGSPGSGSSLRRQAGALTPTDFPLTRSRRSIALRRMMKRTPLLACGLLLAATFTAWAHIQLPAMFSDNMVLQQGAPVPIWGWAHEGDVVTVQFRGQKTSATTLNLKWSLKLRALKPGGPDTLTLSTKSQTLQLTNVLVGEVWLCSG